jgi:hypothetical protein
MTVARTRSFLYQLARFLGDYQAVKRGRVGKRTANKLIRRNAVRRLWRWADQAGVSASSRRAVHSWNASATPPGGT